MNEKQEKYRRWRETAEQLGLDPGPEPEPEPEEAAPAVVEAPEPEPEPEPESVPMRVSARHEERRVEDEVPQEAEAPLAVGDFDDEHAVIAHETEIITQPDALLGADEPSTEEGPRRRERGERGGRRRGRRRRNGGGDRPERPAAVEQGEERREQSGRGRRDGGRRGGDRRREGGPRREDDTRRRPEPVRFEEETEELRQPFPESADEQEPQEVLDEVEPADTEDEDNEEFEDLYANWNVPSWTELIASLYRPER